MYRHKWAQRLTNCIRAEKGHTLLASHWCEIGAGKLSLVWHPARCIIDGGCVDLSVDTMSLKIYWIGN